MTCPAGYRPVQRRVAGRGREWSPLISTDQPREAEWVDEPSVEAVVRVRRQLRAVLIRWGLSGKVVDDAELVAAELLDNVVVHAHTPFRLSVRAHGLFLTLTVHDRRVSVPRARPISVTARRTSGLRVVTAVAFRWGWREHETGKAVWAEFLI